MKKNSFVPYLFALFACFILRIYCAALLSMLLSLIDVATVISRYSFDSLSGRNFSNSLFLPSHGIFNPKGGKNKRIIYL